MDTSQIRQLLKEKLRNGMSEREIGRKTGVAHTTIRRILQGEAISTTTLEKIAEWLDARPADLAYGGESDVAKAVAVILAKEPGLSKVFSELTKRMKTGEVPPEIVREIVRYTIWRMNDALQFPHEEKA